MGATLDRLRAAFGRQRVLRPAVFDQAARRRLDQWYLRNHVPVREVLDVFHRHGGFTTDSGRLLVPVHEPDSAELTGEYLVYHPDQLVPCVTYYDYDRDGMARVDLDRFGATYPAWRIRFWHSAYEPPSVPSYLASATESAGGATVGGHGGDRGRSGGPGLGGTSVAGGSAATARATAEHPVPAEEFFEHVRSFVADEELAEIEDAREAFDRQSPAAFIEDRGGIEHLETRGRQVDREGQQVCIASLPEEEAERVAESHGGVDIPETYGVYPDSRVVLGSRERDAGFPLEAKVLDVVGTSLHLGALWDTAGDKRAAEAAFEGGGGARVHLGNLLNPVPFDRQRAAIDDVEASDRKAGVLAGEREPGFGDSLQLTVDGDLNRFQREAALDALRADDVYCIHGPPGTGKTRTLVAIVRAAVRRGERVLVTAHSNQAVDNLLVGTSTHGNVDSGSLHAAAARGELDLARIGDNSTDDVVLEHYADESYYGADVVGATTSGASVLHEDQFDLAVVDEATQATIPSTLIPYSKAERLVLAGDHRQLPPYTAGEFAEDEEMEVSLFEHLLGLHGEAVSSMLRRQYRMHEDIAAFPNRAFYDGRLTHGQGNRSWTVDDLAPVEGVQVAGEETRRSGGSLFNEAEVEAVCAGVGTLLDRAVPPEEIGVITPYSAQVAKISSAIRQRHGREVWEALEVATVDAFQGGEREAVVVSFVRSNDRGETGFLTLPTEGPRRLNVALTRAKRRLVLVGDWETLAAPDPARGDDDPGSAVFRELREHLRDTGALREAARA